LSYCGLGGNKLYPFPVKANRGDHIQRDSISYITVMRDNARVRVKWKNRPRTNEQVMDLTDLDLDEETLTKLMGLKQDLDASDGSQGNRTRRFYLIGASNHGDDYCVVKAFSTLFDWTATQVDVAKKDLGPTVSHADWTEYVRKLGYDIKKPRKHATMEDLDKDSLFVAVFGNRCYAIKGGAVVGEIKDGLKIGQSKVYLVTRRKEKQKRKWKRGSRGAKRRKRRKVQIDQQSESFLIH